MYSYNRFCNRTHVFMSTWSKFVKNWSIIETYSQTDCEGGAHLRIPFWHLLMNFEKPKKSEFWINETKLLEISSFYTCVPKTIIIWGTVPEIWSENFFLVILGQFLPFTSPPSNNPDNQNFQRMKKASPGDIIILNLRNKKHDQMMYAYSGMERNRHKF